MVKNVFNKGLKAYTPNNPVVISDNRLDNLLPTLNVLSSPKPVVNLASACITISFNEKVKLFTNSFVTANETEPLLGYPVPTDIKGSSAHFFIQSAE